MFSDAESAQKIALLIDELRSEHRLWAPNAAHRVLSRGTENVVIDVGDEFIVRINVQSTRERSLAIATESGLLECLRTELDVDVPEFVVADQFSGVMIYRKLPGRPLLNFASTDFTVLTGALAAVIRTLHTFTDKVEVAWDDQPLVSWLAQATATAEGVDRYLRSDHRGPIGRFLAHDPPRDADQYTLCHNDLGPEHILVDDHGCLVGIIDWTDAALTDPAVDIALVYRDLGPTVAAEIAQHDLLNHPGLMERAIFLARCKWIEDFAYSVASDVDRVAYRQNAIKTFQHTFAGV